MACIPVSFLRLTAAAVAVVGLAPSPTAPALLPPIVVMLFDSDSSDSINRAMVEGLRGAWAERGVAPGRGIQLIAKYSGGHPELLVDRLGDIPPGWITAVVSTGNNATLATRATLPDVPIVMAPNHDAVASGLIDDPERPEGNITGVSIEQSALWPAKVDILAELVTDLREVALFGSGYTEESRAMLDRAEHSLAGLGLTVNRYDLHCGGDIYGAMTPAIAAGSQALMLVEGSHVVDVNRGELGWLSAADKLPIVATDRAFAEAGVLMSLGPSRIDLQDTVADYVVALLEGTPVVELPIHEAAGGGLAINADAHDAFGIAIPEPLLARAALID